MADPELAGDVTGPHALVGQVHDALAHHFWQGSAIHKGPSQLVQPSVAWGDSGTEESVSRARQGSSGFCLYLC